MSEPIATHPLDTDLLDFVEEAQRVTSASWIASHVAECALCRRRFERLQAAQPARLPRLRQLRMPVFEALNVREADGLSARPGELWLTGAETASIVLIRSQDAQGTGVVVVPVALDVEAADSGARVLDSHVSPIGLPIAIYDDLVVSLPASALSACVVRDNEDIDLLSLSDNALGVSRGRALEGPADPRLEVRQGLLDSLVVLDRPLPPEDDSSHALSNLSQELQFRRGPNCVVDAGRAFGGALSIAVDWVIVAQVSEFGIYLIVVSTSSGLNDEADFQAAQQLLVKAGASALVVKTGLSDIVDLYDAPSLFRGIELPSGEQTSHPFIGGLSTVDAIEKYLDHKSRAASSVTNSGAQAVSIDVAATLARQADEAIAAAVNKATRYGEEKRLGYQQLPDHRDLLIETLTSVTRSDIDIDDVVENLKRVDRR